MVRRAGRERPPAELAIEGGNHPREVELSRLFAPLGGRRADTAAARWLRPVQIACVSLFHTV